MPLFEGQTLKPEDQKIIEAINQKDVTVPEQPQAPATPEPVTAPESVAQAPDEPPARPVEHVPVYLLKEAEKKARRLEEERTRLHEEAERIRQENDTLRRKAEEVAHATPQNAADTLADLTQFAQQRGADPELVKTIVERTLTEAEKRLKPSPEVEETLKAFREDQARRAQHEAEAQAKAVWDAKFAEQRTALVSSVPEATTVDPDELKRLFYSERYKNYELADIYTLERHNLVTPHKKSAESGSAGREQTLTIDTADPMGALKQLQGKWGQISAEERQQIYAQLRASTSRLSRS